MYWLPPVRVPTGDQTRNPGMCLDWESNQRPFALQDDAQQTVPHWSVLVKCLYFENIFTKYFKISLLGLCKFSLKFYQIILKHITGF